MSCLLQENTALKMEVERLQMLSEQQHATVELLQNALVCMLFV